MPGVCQTQARWGRFNVVKSCRVTKYRIVITVSATSGYNRSAKAIWSIALRSPKAGPRTRRGAVLVRAINGTESSGEPEELKEKKKFLQALFAVKWDARARTWDKFWNVKTAGTIVNADLDEGTMDAVPVRTFNLNVPSSTEEWADRLQTNLVFYRQNYLYGAVALWGSLTALHNSVALLSIMAGAAGAACLSTSLLGEVQLFLDDKMGVGAHSFTFNETRVLKMDRGHLGRALGVLAVALFCAADPLYSFLLLLRAIGIASLLTFAHASCRPVSLQSFAKSVIQDLKDVKSSKDLSKTVGKAFEKFKRVVKQGPDQEKFTIFNVKGTTQESQGGNSDPPTNQRKPPRAGLPPGA